MSNLRAKRAASALEPHVAGLHRDGVVELVAGNVACKVRLDSVDRARSLAMYDVLLANKSATDIACRLYAMGPAKDVTDIANLDVAGDSLGRSRFIVPLGGRHSWDRIYVEIIGEGVALLSETRLPRPETVKPPLRRIGVTVGSVGLAGALLFFVVHAKQPATALPLQPATHSVAGSYTQPVVAIGAHHVAAPPAVARIVSLSAHRDTYAGDVSVLASYSAVADGGALRIVDLRGAPIAQKPFTRLGTSRIALTGDARYEALRAELAVTNGASHATASVDLPPEAAPAPSVAPSALPSSMAAVADSEGAPAATENDSSSSDPMVVRERVIGGAPFSVAILHHLPGMKLELQDELGTTLDMHDVPPVASTVQFDAPAVSTATTYYISTTFTRGAAQETLVRSLRIFPH